MYYNVPEVNVVKTATIAVRVDAELKTYLEVVFKSLGMTLSEAVNIFLHKAAQTGGIPFPVTNGTSAVTAKSEQDIYFMLEQARSETASGAIPLTHEQVFGALRSKYGKG